MEKILIKDNNIDIIIEIDKKKIMGKKYNNEKIQDISPRDLSYFKYFILSKNCQKLDDYLEYQVYLDKETNFKHYFHDNQEDFKAFFEHNGTPAVLFTGQNSKLSQLKNFFIEKKDIIIKVSLKGLLLGITMSMLTNPIISKAESLTPVKELTTKDIKEMIYISPYLSSEEKDYLYNENFFNTFMKYLNGNILLREKNYIRFNCIQIKSYGKENSLYSSTKGYYSDSDPSIIHIRDYEELDGKEAYLAHEFIHLCQSDCATYTFLLETTAEIISKEFYSKTDLNAHPKDAILLKKLMEIIGTEPILEYCFKGNFQMIEDEIKPYLDNEEYQQFKKCLIMARNNIEQEENRKQLNNIIERIYLAKYQVGIHSNPIMNALDSGTITRYYFNPKYITRAYSYIENPKYQTMTLEQALKNNYVQVIVYTLSPTTYEEIKEITKDENELSKYTILCEKEPFDKQQLLRLPNDFNIESFKDYNEYHFFLYSEKKIPYDEYLNYQLNENEYFTLRFMDGVEGSNLDFNSNMVDVIINKERQVVPSYYEIEFQNKKKNK